MTYENHHGNERAYLRDIILGINDGLISTFLLTIGVYASGLSLDSILLTIISGALSGMISMGLGEYLATKSQKEVTDAEIQKEKNHIEEHLDIELKQVQDFLEQELEIKNQSLIQSFVHEMEFNSAGLLNLMKKIEFGLCEEENRNPWIAMFVSGGLFFTGALPTIISFSVTKNIDTAFYLSIGLNTLALFVVGFGKTLMTKTNQWMSGFENMIFAAIGAVISYTIGFVFSKYLI